MKPFIYILRHTTALLWLTLFFLPPLLAQPETAAIRQSFEQYQSKTLTEKLFVHTDRSFYLTGEILWFKLFYVDGTLHQSLDMSKVAYLEIVDKDQKPVLQSKIALENGSGKGSFFLPASLTSGYYVVRAYTNWMKNSGPDFFFQKTITIVNPFKKLGLEPEKEAVAYNIQFFPEGGNLVNNLTSKVAFKVSDQHGKGIDFQGSILDENNNIISQFNPLQFGIGHFFLTPAPNKKYKAVIKDKQGKSYTYDLPTIYEEGYVMQVEELPDTTLKITIHIQSKSNHLLSSHVYLLAHTRQSLKVVEAQVFNDNKAVFLLDKDKLGEGISHLTIFDTQKHPICERLYFKRPTQALVLDIKADKNAYGIRDKVSLNFLATSSDGKPVITDMSASIYRLDSLQSSEQADITSYLLLTSDLKGTIQSPQYYLKNKSPQTDEALDNLMLTHGWRRFRWEDILNHKTSRVEFVPEYGGHFIKGRVLDLKSRKPAKDILTYLTPLGSSLQVYGSQSDSLGNILFEVKDFLGSKKLIIQAKPSGDSLYQFEITNPFSSKFSTTSLPSFTLAKELASQILSNSISMQVQNAYYADKLNAIHVPTTDSSTFYGQPDERYRLDDFTRFTTMEDVLREYVLGARARKRKEGYELTVYDHTHNHILMADPMVLVDGVPVFDFDKFMTIHPLKLKRMDVLTRRYALGPLFFNGLVSCTSYKGDLGGYQLDPHILILDYDGLQQQREFYAPTYDSPKQLESRLPDQRSLLYWSADLKTNAQGKKQVNFYTSDQVGKYVVVVNGITQEGLSGSGVFTFEVSNPTK